MLIDAKVILPKKSDGQTPLRPPFVLVMKEDGISYDDDNETRKLQDAQAEKLACLQANKLTSW